MAKINTLSLDLETYSDVDLGKCGVYKYAESENFEILLFGYSINRGEVQVIDLARGQIIPEEILRALVDNTVQKWAFNASFERVCLSNWIRRERPDLFISYGIPEDPVRGYLDPESWRCSMIWAAYMGLPLSLEGVGAVLNLGEQKLKEGKDLIRYFCVPCKPTKANGGRVRNLPEHAPDKWDLFVKYNKRDVEVEQSIQKRLASYPVPDSVWEEYHIDQEINDRGIAVDMTVVRNAIAFDSRSKEELTAAMKKLTDLDNPNSVAQMKRWLSDNGCETESLGKKIVSGLIEETDGDVSAALLLRQQLAKSSVKKYQAMQNAVCEDQRVHGMFQFYGANRSGRFAGRLVQLQNLPQNHLEDLEGARNLLKDGNYDAMDLLFDSVPSVLSELIRTAFIARDGYKFIVSDYSAIEARVLSWLAGEQWRMDVFKAGGDIYCETASRMFHCNVVKHGENGHLRQKGKQGELSCGYGGGKGALIAMGALESGMKEEELQPLVDAWRAANPNIVRMWWDFDKAVKTTIKTKCPQESHGIRFIYQAGMMFIKLPSGRCLSYVKPRIGENKFGGESVTYEGVGATKKWERIESYGPKFTENIVQAISRDILCNAMKTLRHCFIVAHIHDELVIECSPDTSLEAICEQMVRTPDWAPGLVLRADGYETQFYKKD